MKNKRQLRGQSIIEFVLIFPIAFFLLTGFLDLGRGIFYYSSLSNAVREGTRYAIVQYGLDEEAIKDQVMEYAFALNNTSSPLLREDILVEPVEPQAGEPFEGIVTGVRITATYTFQPITPGVARLLGNPSGIDLIAQSTMRISGVYR